MASFGGESAKFLSEKSPNPTIEDNIICLCVKILLKYYLFFWSSDYHQVMSKLNKQI